MLCYYRRKNGFKQLNGTMKKCSKCKEEKELDLFPIDKRKKDGRQSSCRKCHTIQNSISRRKAKSHFFLLYYLPEEHYIGITNHINTRMSDHRKVGKITEGYEIIGQFERAVDAHLVETMFHMRGYNGFRY